MKMQDVMLVYISDTGKEHKENCNKRMNAYLAGMNKLAARKEENNERK